MRNGEKACCIGTEGVGIENHYPGLSEGSGNFVMNVQKISVLLFFCLFLFNGGTVVELL